MLYISHNIIGFPFFEALCKDISLCASQNIYLEVRNKLSLGSRMSNPKDRNTMNRIRLYLTAIFTGVLYIILVVNTPVVSGKEITKRTLNGQVGIINGKYSDIAG